MNESHLMLSDHLLEALAAMNRAREACRDESVNNREAVVRELANAESSVARVLQLITGRAEA